MPDDKKPKDLTFEYAPEVLARLEADPDLAAALRDMQAMMHQAHHDVQTGRYATFEEAMAAQGAVIEPVDLDDPDDEPCKRLTVKSNP